MKHQFIAVPEPFLNSCQGCCFRRPRLTPNRPVSRCRASGLLKCGLGDNKIYTVQDRQLIRDIERLEAITDNVQELKREYWELERKLRKELRP